MTGRSTLLIVALFLALAGSASAAEPTPKQKLETCLKKASDLPDVAAADANNWLKHGGGEYARLCRASAYFNSNDFLPAAGEFTALADLHAKSDPHHAAELYARAGLSYMRGEDTKSAEAMYAKALKLEPDDPEFWIDRATERVEIERYWDAIHDLNQALAIMPDLSDALRLRAQAWVKLGNKTNAEHDFMAAEDIDASEGVKPTP